MSKIQINKVVEVEAKPCPFCASRNLEVKKEIPKDCFADALRVAMGSQKPKSYFISCKKCGATGPVGGQTQEASITKWGLRIPVLFERGER